MIFIQELVLGISLFIFTTIGDDKPHMYVSQPFATTSMETCQGAKKFIATLGAKVIMEEHGEVRIRQFSYNCASMDNPKFGIIPDKQLMEVIENMKSA